MMTQSEYIKAYWKRMQVEEPERYREFKERDRIRSRRRYRNNDGGYRDKERKRCLERYHEKHPEAKYRNGYGKGSEDKTLEKMVDGAETRLHHNTVSEP